MFGLGAAPDLENLEPSKSHGDALPGLLHSIARNTILEGPFVAQVPQNAVIGDFRSCRKASDYRTVEDVGEGLAISSVAWWYFS